MWLKPYWNRRLELSVHAGCILWGLKVVVPQQGRSTVLAELHGAHPGMTRMKALVWQWMWWPNIDQAVEDAIKQCEECQYRIYQIHHQRHFTSYSGPHAHGLGYILISLDPWMVRCFL